MSDMMARILNRTDYAFGDRALLPEERDWLAHMAPRPEAVEALEEPHTVARVLFALGRQAADEIRETREAALAYATRERAKRGDACCQGADEADGLRVEGGRLEFILYDGHDSAAHVWAACAACPLCGARWGR